MKMKIVTKDFLVREGADVKHLKWRTKIEPVCPFKKKRQKLWVIT